MLQYVTSINAILQGVSNSQKGCFIEVSQDSKEKVCDKKSTSAASNSAAVPVCLVQYFGFGCC